MVSSSLWQYKMKSESKLLIVCSSCERCWIRRSNFWANWGLVWVNFVFVSLLFIFEFLGDFK